MYTKYKVLAAALMLTAVLCIQPLAAQITSNTNNATTGLFSTDVDNFLDVNSWQEVEFNNFFSVFQVGGADGIGAGMAMSAGSSYLGFGYIGNFWSGADTIVTTEYGNSYTAANSRGKKTTSYSGSGLKWNSQIFFLFGAAPVGGLLLDLNFADAGNNVMDRESINAGGSVVTEKESVGLGALEAGLSWGKNFDLGGGYVFKPNVGFSYNFDLQKTVADTGPGSTETTTLNGQDDFFRRADYNGVNNGTGRVGLAGYIAAHLGLGFDLSTSTADGSLWLGYDLEYHLYDKQTESSGYWEDYSPSYLKNFIDIGVGAWYTIDRRLSLGWFVGSGFSIENASVTSVKKNGGAEPDNEYTEVIFGITPMISAGVVHKFLPDKFNINGSLALFPIGYTFSQFKDVDKRNAMTITRTDNTIESLAAQTSLGFTWFITDGLSFDAYLTTLANGSRLNLTNFSALLSYKR